jgi:hypothetical protein
VPDRWKKKIESDNRGRPLPVWCWLDYELCENVNLGLEGGWVFELIHKKKHLELYPNLEAGKEGADQHHARAAAPTEADVEVGVAS